jgi:pyruvate dehydrogenase complex dehydrogenase (E1) component
VSAATDSVRAVPESILARFPARRHFVTLGMDGCGRSETCAALEQFFSADAASILNAARHALARQP